MLAYIWLMFLLASVLSTGLKEVPNSKIVYKDVYGEQATLKASDYPVGLSPTTFADIVRNQDVFVVFFSHYCPHCVHFYPTYTEMARKLHPKIKLFSVNCVLNRDLCTQFNVKFYPSIRLFTKMYYFECETCRTEEGLVNYFEQRETLDRQKLGNKGISFNPNEQKFEIFNGTNFYNQPDEKNEEYPGVTTKNSSGKASSSPTPLKNPTNPYKYQSDGVHKYPILLTLVLIFTLLSFSLMLYFCVKCINNDPIDQPKTLPAENPYQNTEDSDLSRVNELTGTI